jgi:YYY domain-containing protein
MDLSTQLENEPKHQESAPRAQHREVFFTFLGLLVVLLVGAYFRFSGLFWGDNQYQHPDERFLIWVVSDIAPTPDLSAYFDTAKSSLNPANRGHQFYVYGDFPVILTRYVTEAFYASAGWEEVLQTGRSLSALFDLLTVLLVYLTAERLARDGLRRARRNNGGRPAAWPVAALAGLFAAGAVLQIQQAHFFTVDSFATSFTTLAVYLGVCIAVDEDLSTRTLGVLSGFFGLAVGLAMASKLNTAPVALLLPAALGVRWLRTLLPNPRANSTSAPQPDPSALLLRLAGLAVIGGVVALLAFRLAQPYAFKGPGFFNVSLDPGWVESLRQLSAQSAGDVDFPPALQWARRTHLFSLENMVLWGLGLPLGILSWVGFFCYLVRAALWLKDRRFDDLLHEGGALLVWGWTAVYFTWQSLAWNPTMRYQLPVYPTLAILAAWGLNEFWTHPPLRFQRSKAWRIGLAALGGLALLLTLAWAYAFTGIYTRPETRVAASRWIFQNEAAPVTLEGDPTGVVKPQATPVDPQSTGGAAVLDTSGFAYRQLLPVTEGTTLYRNKPYRTQFDSLQGGVINSITLPKMHVSVNQSSIVENLRLRVTLYDPQAPNHALAVAETSLLSNTDGDTFTLPFEQSPTLLAVHRYALTLEIAEGSAAAPESAPSGAPSDTDFSISAVFNGAASLNLYARAQSASIQNVEGAPSALFLSEGGTLRQIEVDPANALSGVTIELKNIASQETQTSVASLAQNASGGMAAAPENGASDAAAPDAAAPNAAASLKAILKVDPPLTVKPGVNYMVTLYSTDPGAAVSAASPIQLDFLDGALVQYLPMLTTEARPDDPLYLPFTPTQDVNLRQVSLGYVSQEDSRVGGASGLTLRVYRSGDLQTPLGETKLSASMHSSTDARGLPVSTAFNPPLALKSGETYTLSIAPQSGVIAVRGAALANESSWDMGLPFRMDNYDPYGGIYRGDLNFEMYWPDNAEKYQRFINILDQADTLAFSSNRQWGTTVRVPERYPLTTEFYRRLLGCPADKDVLWCYRVAEPGMFQGELGFDLVRTFTSYPTLGPISINTQFAEEAFTVYDAPKVMVFRKNADYDAAKVQALLGAVDLDNVINLTPKKAGSYKDGLLTPVLAAIQQAGGTWAQLFPPDSPLNRYPGVGLVAWYLFLMLFGAALYPLVRLALPGLPDRGYPLARIAALVLLAYLAWIAGSLGVPVTRLLLAGIVAALSLAGVVLGLLQRDELRAEWRERRGYFLTVELVALVFFSIELLIRFANPDLWHPIYGGEKPMDFSFFNAVLKSSVFPPYDPWFAGGAINYYYYGFVLVGMPVKLLGITPSVAYNLVLPALFCMVALGAFSMGWNLFVSAATAAHSRADKGAHADTDNPQPKVGERVSAADAATVAAAAIAQPNAPVKIYALPSEDGKARVGVAAHAPDAAISSAAAFTEPAIAAAPHSRVSTTAAAAPALRDLYRRALLAGLAAAIALLLLGNLGTMRMVWQGWQLSVVPEETMKAGSLFQHIGWAGQGLIKSISGQGHQYYTGDWYWKPSRAIQPEAGNEITEFPFFTFIYADLHAHLMALPVTLLALAWALAVMLGLGRWGRADGRLKGLSLALALLLGGLTVGALRPANTWDQYTYLALAALALLYAHWPRVTPGETQRPGWQQWLWTFGPPLVLAALAILLYRPFDAWFAQGYNQLDLWEGNHTGLDSYLVHWGLFLLVIAAWLADELIDWMAQTPISALTPLRRSPALRRGIITVTLALAAVLLFLLYRGVWVALLVFPLGLTAAALLFRPNQPTAKRAVLFMTGTALALTLAVELVAVHGDIGRMNTVFKFYYQAWTLLSISAAAGLFWLWPRLSAWNPTLRGAWRVMLALLVVCAALFPITAARAKIIDRMMADSPMSLDGMEYMATARYTDGDTTQVEMDLSEDYRAIRWAEQNIPGSPVIVEANTPEYRHWGTRFTIYTGLPGVVGWNWHERQQRALTPDTWVYDRIDAVGSFFRTTDLNQAIAFLKQYNVQYIVVGQIERVWYGPEGLAKFEENNGSLWDRVYQDGQTAIYKVR